MTTSSELKGLLKGTSSAYIEMHRDLVAQIVEDLAMSSLATPKEAGSQPECPKCHGRGWTEEGDPEAGGDMRPCECRGIGKPAVPWPWKDASEVIQEAIDHMGHQPRIADALRTVLAALAAPADGAKL